MLPTLLDRVTQGFSRHYGADLDCIKHLEVSGHWPQRYFFILSGLAWRMYPVGKQLAYEGSMRVVVGCFPHIPSIVVVSLSLASGGLLYSGVR